MASVRALTLAAVLLGSSGTGICADDKISTDRPDFLTSPNVVGKGRFQIETGVLVQRDDVNDTRTRTVSTPTLLRLGLTDQIELRLDGDGRMRTRETDLATQATVHAHGWADSAIGIKWNTHEGDAKKGTPTIGWVFRAELPTGSRAFRVGGVRPTVLGAFEWELRDEMAFSMNAGLTYDRDATEGRFVSGLLGAGLSKGLTERLSIAAEVVALQIAASKYGGIIAIADVGVKYLLTDNLQVDALVGRGVTSESPKYLFTVGVSARF